MSKKGIELAHAFNQAMYNHMMAEGNEFTRLQAENAQLRAKLAALEAVALPEKVRPAIDRLRKIVNDLYCEGEDDGHEIWRDLHMPDTRITLGECRALLAHIEQQARTTVPLPEKVGEICERLRGRVEQMLPGDWQRGRKCPECGSDATRPKCFHDMGPSCPRHDPDAYDPPAWVEVPDKDCHEAAALLEQQARTTVPREDVEKAIAEISRIAKHSSKNKMWQSGLETCLAILSRVVAQPDGEGR